MKHFILALSYLISLIITLGVCILSIYIPIILNFDASWGIVSVILGVILSISFSFLTSYVFLPKVEKWHTRNE